MSTSTMNLSRNLMMTPETLATLQQYPAEDFSTNGNSSHPNRRPLQRWNQVQPMESYNPITGLRSYTPGWAMNVYNADHTHYFKIPSESILVTKGAEKYITLFNAHGPYMKYRFQLCWENLTGVCRFRERCSFIHCLSTAGVEVTDVHYNAADAEHRVHPAGQVIRVFAPNSSTEYEDIVSEAIVITRRSIDIFSSHTSARRSQHCAHFYLNHVCTRGSLCNFIHALAHYGNVGTNFSKQGRRATAATATTASVPACCPPPMPPTLSTEGCGLQENPSLAMTATEAGLTMTDNGSIRTDLDNFSMTAVDCGRETYAAAAAAAATAEAQ